MTARTADEHGREFYTRGEVPPVDAGLAMWMGNVTADYPPNPANQVSGCHPGDGRKPYAECFRGWVRSGRWWLHCADCHPAPEPRCPGHPTYPMPCAMCAFQATNHWEAS